MVDTKLRIKHETEDSCFELLGSRQHGVGARSRMFNQREVSCLLNARDEDSGWTQIQMFSNVKVRDHEK